MSNTPDPLKYREYTERAFLVRGMVINETIMLERALDNYLAAYFCSDFKARKQLMELLICTDRVTFGSKRDILKHILTTEKPKFIDENPTFFADLEIIIQERNILAHYWLNTSNVSIDKIDTNLTIELTKFKNKVSGIEYDKGKFGELLDRISSCIKIAIKLATE